MNIGGSESMLLRGLKIVLVRGDHHDLLGFEVEQSWNEKIDFRVRFVALHVFRRENAVPGQTGVLRHVGE